MDDTKNNIILPYVEAIKIKDVSLALGCSIDDIIEWARRDLINLCIDINSLYGELSISCRRDAPVINNYINLLNEINKKYLDYNRKSITDFDFQDLFKLLPANNRPLYNRGRSLMDKYLKNESDEDYFKLRFLGKGEGFWIFDYYNLKRQKIRTINSQEFFKVRSLILNYKYYDAKSLPQNYAEGLKASFLLFDEILVSSDEFYIHYHDFNNLINNKFVQGKNDINNIKEKSLNIGKPPHFYKNFAIDTAYLTRNKNPQSKVADIARKIHLTIIDNFNSVNPPTKDTISNWLYEIKLGKPTEKSNNDFELVIPEEFSYYFE